MSARGVLRGRGRQAFAVGAVVALAATAGAAVAVRTVPQGAGSGDAGPGADAAPLEVRPASVAPGDPTPIGENPSMTRDGRLVAFESAVDGLVPGDANGKSDIFVLDRVDNTLQWVSKAADGTAADGDSTMPSIAGLGQFVVFTSTATDLHPDDQTAAPDVYRANLGTGALDRVSKATAGQPDSPYGATNTRQAITDNGRWVAFTSLSSNHVANDTNNRSDVFVWDALGNPTRRVSVRDNGQNTDGHSANAAINANGTVVAFQSDATNLSFVTDANGKTDIFQGSSFGSGTFRVSVDAANASLDGDSFNPTVDSTGNWIAFASDATNAVAGDANGHTDVFLRAKADGSDPVLVSRTPGGAVGDGTSNEPLLSGDASTISFLSDSTDLVAGDTNGVVDLFTYDRVATTVTRASVSSSGAEANGPTGAVALDNTGKVLLFVSAATNLGTADNNGVPDLFVRDAVAGTTGSGNPGETAPGGNLVKGWSFEPPLVPSTNGYAFLTFGLPDEDALGPWDIEAGGVDVVGKGAANADDGVQFVDLNGNGVGQATIGQDLFVEGGHTYTVSLKMSGNPNGEPAIKTVEASFGGHTEVWTFDKTGHTNQDLGWAARTFDVTIPCGTTVSRLRLHSLTESDDDRGPNIDTVSVVDTEQAPKGPFPDVATTHPFCPDITWLVGRGITGGYGDGTFKPAAPITRQAMAAFLFRYAHPADPKPVCSGPAFPDVPKDATFCGEIAWLAGEGITGGYSDGTFKPAAPISRQAMAAFLYRVAHPGADKPTCTADAPFPDVPTDHTFCGEVAWLAATAITGGYEDGTFKPGNAITRQAMAAFLHRYAAL